MHKFRAPRAHRHINLLAHHNPQTMPGSFKTISLLVLTIHLACAPLSILAQELTCDSGERLEGDKCIACEPGTFKFFAYHTDTKCTNCPAGTFYGFPRASGRIYCHTCPENTFSGPGSAKCTKCPEGQVSAFNSKKCSPLCQPGFGLSYDRSCKPCALGLFNDGTFRTCQPCLSGKTTFKTGSAKCLACPAGTFRDVRFVYTLERVPVNCQKCQPNTFSKPGATQCKLCPVGSLANGRRTGCKTCPAGTYRRMISSLKCEKCPTGTSSKGKRPAGCKHPKRGCPVHTYEDATGECRGCMPGQRLDTIKKRCVPCKQNEVSAGGDSTICRPCPKNSAPEKGLTHFERARCRCSPGLVPGRDGEDSDDWCVPCPAGEFWENHEDNHENRYHLRSDFVHPPSCSACLPGQYTDKPGMAKCKTCPPGSISSIYRAKRCEPCPEGSRPSPSNSEFFGNPFGSGADACIQLKNACRVGQVRLSNGVCDLKKCPPNYFIARQECHTCGPTSRYDPERNQCVNCKNHEWNANQSEEHLDTTCVACGKAWAFSQAGCTCKLNQVLVGNRCKPCPVGKFASESGVCKDCPANKVPDSFGKENYCVECSGNSYKASAMDQECTKCPSGSLVAKDFLGQRLKGCMSKMNYAVAWLDSLWPRNAQNCK